MHDRVGIGIYDGADARQDRDVATNIRAELTSLGFFRRSAKGGIKHFDALGSQGSSNPSGRRRVSSGRIDQHRTRFEARQQAVVSMYNGLYLIG